MNTSSVILRKMQLDDIPGAMKLSAAEGWNQCEFDWRLFIENPQNICMLASCDNEVVGTTTAMNYVNELAWIAMVLVDKAYRSKGISKSLLENVLEKSGSFASIKLDATPAGQQVYTKFGFKEESRITRMVRLSVKKEAFNHDEAIAQVDANDIPGIIALDKIVFGADRTMLIESLIRQYPHKAWTIKQDKVITGFALGRNGSKYHHIGPVVASNPEDAGKLIKRAIKEPGDQPVVADVLCDKEDLVQSLQAKGFARQRDFVRMYRNENPFPGAVHKCYLICGPEFG